jgi:hypothetical protein
MGFRIPAVVVSPYARRSHIDHTIYGFESILKMIRYRYGLPPRTPRDLYSNNIASAFDFASKPRYDPPALPQPAEVISSPCSGLPISAGSVGIDGGSVLGSPLGSVPSPPGTRIEPPRADPARRPITVRRRWLRFSRSRLTDGGTPTTRVTRPRPM